MKGEKIVTSLLDKVVTPRSEHVLETVWPSNWPTMHEGAVAKGEPVHQAQVVGVYLNEGLVYILVKNLIDGRMMQSVADNWRVIR